MGVYIRIQYNTSQCCLVHADVPLHTNNGILPWNDQHPHWSHLLSLSGRQLPTALFTTIVPPANSTAHTSTVHRWFTAAPVHPSSVAATLEELRAGVRGKRENQATTLRTGQPLACICPWTADSETDSL